MADSPAIEALLRRDRIIVAVGLLVIVALSWLWLFTGAGTGMSSWAMTTWSFPPPISSAPAMTMAWPLSYWLIMLTMWWVMMIAMMTPSAAPMVLLHARVSRHAQARGRMPPAVIPTGLFFTGYLASWFLFSLVATALQWGLEQAGLVHGMRMWSLSRPLSGALLVAAGAYQFSALKAVCLEHCRAPTEYLSKHWRAGRWGAFRMGLGHGAYCVGCCWVLMALLFVGGTMNLIWIAGLSILVLGEKLAPAGHRLAHLIGALMIAAGLWLWFG